MVMNGFNWADVLAAFILVFSMYYGWKKGFIVAAIDFIKWIAAIILARLFHLQFTTFIKNTLWDPTEAVGGHVRNFLTDLLGYDKLTEASLTQNQITEALETLNLPEQLETVISNGLNENMVATSIGFVEEVTVHLTQMIVNGLGFLVLVVLLLMAFGIVQVLGNFIAKLPILKELNQGAGLIMGGIIGLITVYFIMAILTYIPTFSWSREAIVAVEDSKFAIYFYKYNILQYVFNTIIIQGSLKL